MAPTWTHDPSAADGRAARAAATLVRVTPRRALVLTVSTRTAAGVWEDRSGPVLRDGLVALGLTVDGPEVAADGDPVEQALRAAVAAGYDLVVTRSEEHTSELQSP